MKKKLQRRSFSRVELAYDIAMRRNIPVNILFTSLTKDQHTILIIKYCLAGCDIGSTFFGIGRMSVFKRMIQGALKFQGLNDFGHGSLSNCQSLLALSFLEQYMNKLEPKSLNEVSCTKAATKVLSTGFKHIAQYAKIVKGLQTTF